MKRLVYALLAVALLSSCSKDAVRNLDPDETNLYITNKDEAISFASYQTFALSDSAVVIQNNQLVEKVRTDFDAAFIDALAAQMTARGYTRVSHDNNPDLGLTVNRIYNDYSGVIDYYDYWNYYGGYWDPYYWGYPGYNYYPGFFGIYTITDGGVMVDMIDLKNASASSQLKLIWNGLVRGTGTFGVNRAAGHVNALFAQSPYITTP